MTFSRNNELALVEARVKSNDWQGQQTLQRLINGGSWLLVKDDAHKIEAMSPARRERALRLIQQWNDLADQAQALSDEIKAELEQEVEQ